MDLILRAIFQRRRAYGTEVPRSDYGRCLLLNARVLPRHRLPTGPVDHWIATGSRSLPPGVRGRKIDFSHVRQTIIHIRIGQVSNPKRPFTQFYDV